MTKRVKGFTTIVSTKVLRHWSEEELRVADYEDESVPREYVPAWLVAEREKKREEEEEEWEDIDD